MLSDEDLFNFDAPLEPKRDAAAPASANQPPVSSAPLPSVPGERRQFNWWAVLAIGLLLFVGINALRSFWPAGGGSVDGLRVLIVEEKDDRKDLPSEQRAVLTSVKIREWCDANCTKLDGHPAARVFDKDEVMDHDNPFWVELMKRERKKLPWIYAIGGNGKQVDQPLPKDVDSTLELLEAAK